MEPLSIITAVVSIVKTLAGRDVSREVGDPLSPDKPFYTHRRFIGMALVAVSGVVAWITGVKIPEAELNTLGDAGTQVVQIFADNKEAFVALWGAVLTVVGIVFKRK